MKRDDGYFLVREGRGRVMPSGPTAHHDFGFEDATDFLNAVRAKYDGYAGRVGLAVEHRPGRCRLQLCDDYGDLTDDRVWFFDFMLRPCPPPLHSSSDAEDPDPIEALLNEAYGFD